jgi:hypothetical protein
MGRKSLGNGRDGALTMEWRDGRFIIILYIIELSATTNKITQSSIIAGDTTGNSNQLKYTTMLQQETRYYNRTFWIN